MKHKIGGSGKRLTDCTVIGFALFAMFFGAGNLIFPPDLGVRSGSEWFIAFICYFIADIGLGILAVYSMTRVDGKIESITSPIGKLPALVMTTAIIICIGPGLAIPRTAATTFELGVAPLFEVDPGNRTLRAVFSVIFFGIVLALTIRPNKVVDIIGKVLTPVLLVSLLIMIVTGILYPHGEVGAPVSQNVVKDGFYNGYQTLDLMASMFFAIVIINAVHGKGYSGLKETNKMTITSSLIAGILLFIVYGGLTILGATTGSIWTGEVASGSMNQAALLISITIKLLGKPGMALLAIVVAFACLTTAIGLVSSTAEFFSKMTNGKIPQKPIIIVTAVISMLICNLGLSKIISFSAPILMLLYPLTVLLVVTSLLRSRVTKLLPYRLASAVTLAISACDLLGSSFGIKSFAELVAKLPLHSYGFNWLIPAVAAFLIGCILPFGKRDTDQL